MSFYRAIDSIRSSLYNQGYDPMDVDSVCEEAAEELSALIADIVAGALDEAESAGIQAGMKDFVAELTAIQMGDSFRITTTSGRHDYSTPKKMMLKSLLKNAKVAKDGSLYKRIPISDKGPNPTSSFDVDKSRNTHLEKVKNEINANIRSGGLGKDIGKAARDFASSFTGARENNKPAAGKRPVKAIVTASSKQNPDTQWVIPAKEMDAQDILEDVNQRLNRGIEDAMRLIYERYGR